MSNFEADGSSGPTQGQEAEDTVDLWMPDLMAEAAQVNEWDEPKAFNFIRRAYTRGKFDGITQILEEIEQIEEIDQHE